jgi:hypothetical protein
MQSDLFRRRDEDPYAWLYRYHKAMRCNRWSYRKALRRVGWYLKGIAEAWFDALEGMLETWDDFEAAFEAKYLDKTYAEQAWNALQAFRTKEGLAVVWAVKYYRHYLWDVILLYKRIILHYSHCLRHQNC